MHPFPRAYNYCWHVLDFYYSDIWVALLKCAVFIFWLCGQHLIACLCAVSLWNLMPAQGLCWSGGRSPWHAAKIHLQGSHVFVFLFHRTHFVKASELSPVVDGNRSIHQHRLKPWMCIKSRGEWLDRKDNQSESQREKPKAPESRRMNIDLLSAAFQSRAYMNGMNVCVAIKQTEACLFFFPMHIHPSAVFI